MVEGTRLECADPDSIIEQMMREHADYVLRLCLLYLNDYHLAEDAMQETFIKAHRGLSRFRGDSSAHTWLTRIAVNTCKDMLRSPWRRRYAGEEALRALPDPDGPPRAQDDTVLQAVMALPNKYKDVILLRYYEGMPLKDIAAALSLSVPTVSTRIARAQKRLHTQLKGWYFDEE